MVLQFIRRDPAWSVTPWFTAAAVLAAVLYSAFDETWMAMMLLPVYLVFYMRAAPHRRVTFFEAALPVPGRDLFMARFLALAGMVWLPALAAAGILLLTGRQTPEIPDVMVGALLVTLSVIVSLSARIQEFAAPVWLTLFCPVVAVSLIIPLLTWGRPLWAIAGIAAITLAVGARVWRSVPDVFQSAPLEETALRTKKGNAAPSLPWWPVLRSLVPWQIAIFAPISLLWSATGEWVFAPMYLMMGYGQLRLSTRWTLALPISRRLLLAIAVIPLLLVLGGGAEIGMLTGMSQRQPDLIHLGDPEHFRARGAIDVFVNREFWERAPNGRVPVVRAPWGETVQPPPNPVLGLTFYNPYTVGQKNSLQFQDWQFARATRRIYSQPVRAPDLAKAVKAGLKPITVRTPMQILSIAAIMAGGLFWAWIVELVSWHRLTRLSSPVRNALTFVGMLVPLSLIFGLDVFVGGGPGSISKAAIEGGLLALSNTLPGNPILLALIALTPLAGLWWVFERQAAAAEVTTPQGQASSIFDRGR